MGNHGSHAGERRHKDFAGGPPAVPRLDGQPLSIKPGPRANVLKSQASEEDHEPLFCTNSPKVSEFNHNK